MILWAVKNKELLDHIYTFSAKNRKNELVLVKKAVFSHKEQQ
jgi:hypothetical protein